MKDDLPKHVKKIERGIVNLDNSNGRGTHWIAYKKDGKDIHYFDSYGDLRPPLEVERYLLSDGRGNVIKYNYRQYQRGSEKNCGELCLKFLMNKTCSR